MDVVVEGEFPEGKAEKASVEWFGFAAYPGARELCWQSVLRQDAEEILWYSYVTQDKPAEVIAFYVKENDNDKQGRRRSEAALHGPCDGGIESCRYKARAPILCNVEAKLARETVIVVSRMSGGGER